MNESAKSKEVVFPSLPTGADVSERHIGIKIEAEKWDISRRYVGSTIGVVATSYFLVPPPDLFFRDSSGNEIAIWRQRAYSTGNDLYRPLIIAEGIDIGDSGEPDGYFGQLGSLANVVRDGGYDVAVVSFGDPLESVRVHEDGFRNALQLVHQMKSNPSQPTAVMGISRGGVVARYALAKMEELGVPHHASLFISYDAPQRGANINAGIQNLIFEELDGDPEGQVLIDQLKSDAVRELLQDHVDNPAGRSNPHQVFYQELRALNGRSGGYPIDLRTVAWSNGTWATPQFNGDLFLKVDADASGRDIEIELSTLDRQPGSHLPASFRNIVDGKAEEADVGVIKSLAAFGLHWFVTPFTGFTQQFGANYSIHVYNDPTFIPTASALDMDGPSDTTPFDRVEHSGIRRSHDAVPDEAVLMILEELGLWSPPPPPPLTVSISGPTYLDSGEEGTWYADVSGGDTPYSYQWEYKLLDDSCYPILPPPGSFSGTDGGVGTDDVDVCGWANGGTDASFTRGGGYDLQIRLTVTDSANDEVVSYISVDTEGNGNYAIAQSQAEVMEATGTPATYALAANAPNPFSSSTTISYELPEPAHVELLVYDVLGRVVARLVDAPKEAGYHQVLFVAEELPSGVYFYSIKAGEFTKTKRMLLVQ